MCSPAIHDAHVVGPHLHHTAMGKAAGYLPTPQGTLPPGIRFWPIVYSATRLAWIPRTPVAVHAAGARVECSHGPDVSPWGPHFTQLIGATCATLSSRIAIEPWRKICNYAPQLAVSSAVSLVCMYMYECARMLRLGFAPFNRVTKIDHGQRGGA